MSNKKALITGITGQDGSYLAEFLLEKGYEVHGIVRRSDHHNFSNIIAIKNQLKLHYGDLIDSNTIRNIIYSIKPDEIYNLAAQSHVGVSFEVAEYTAKIDSIAVLNILEAIKDHPELRHKVRFYQASSSEMFGKVIETPQTEKTPFYPRSPYGCSKVFSHHLTVNYREAYGIHASSGILFNHESPRRGPNFVTRKIVNGLISYLYSGDILLLGNLDAIRDWGHAKDYVYAMWLMLQQEIPDDYVICTGEAHTVRQVCELVCQHLNIKLEWQGKGLDEVGVNSKNGDVIIKISEEFYRPTEVDLLLGNCSKAKNILKWKPKYNFERLIEEMVDFEYELDHHR